MIDVQKIRKLFPILNEKINENDLIYFDNGATTQKPKAVIDAINNYYTHENSNVHRGVHHLSQIATDKFEVAAPASDPTAAKPLPASSKLAAK